LTNKKNGLVVYLTKEGGVEMVYTTNQLVPALGDVLQLEVSVKGSGETIFAVDSISSTLVSFRLVDTGVNVVDNSSGNTTECYVYRTGIIRFLPVGSKGTHYYDLVVYVTEYDDDSEAGEEYRPVLTSSTSLVTSEDYYPSKTSIDAINPQSLLFKCTAGNDSVTIDFSYATTLMLTMNGTISYAHNLRVELRRVSYAYYQYKTALYKQENAILGDVVYGSAPPVIIPSNVENGTGIFAGYNATNCQTFIDRYIYERK
jgi:hypothetical protein